MELFCDLQKIPGDFYEICWDLWGSNEIHLRFILEIFCGCSWDFVGIFLSFFFRVFVEDAILNSGNLLWFSGAILWLVWIILRSIFENLLDVYFLFQGALGDFRRLLWGSRLFEGF